MESLSLLADLWRDRNILERMIMRDNVSTGHIDLLPHRMHNQQDIHNHFWGFIIT